MVIEYSCYFLLISAVLESQFVFFKAHISINSIPEIVNDIKRFNSITELAYQIFAR